MDDAIAMIESRLALARQDAARALDRAEALAELRFLAHEARQRLDLERVDLDALRRSRKSETERARLSALCARALSIDPEGVRP